MPRIIQWSVTAGVWWCLLVDVLGNWAGQDHAASWLPIILGTGGVVVFVHGAMAKDLLSR